MNDLINLISSLDVEEVGRFLAFAKARNKRHDVHNIELFKLIRAGASEDLDLKIYGSPNKNALYALKGRLQSSLLECIAIKGFENDQKTEMAALKLLLSARIMLEKEFFSLGLKCLKKAEYLATQAELFTVLHEIYLTHLEYAHQFPTMEWEAIHRKFVENKSLLHQADQIAILFSEHKNAVDEYGVGYYQRQLVVSEIVISPNLSFKNLYELLEVVTDAATLEGNYNLIYTEISAIEMAVTEKEKPVGFSPYYFDLLFLLALSHFRLSNFKKSQVLLSEIDTVITISKAKKQNIITLQSLCLNYLGEPQEAIDHVSTIKDMSLEARCVLAMFHLQQQEPQNALRQLNKLQHRDSYYEKHHSKALVVKKNLLLLLIYIDLGNINLIDSQLSSLRKKSTVIRQLKEPRVGKFLRLVIQHYNNPQVVATRSFHKKMEELSKNDFTEDVFAVSFYAWLKSKVLKRPLYEVTMELVSN